MRLTNEFLDGEWETFEQASEAIALTLQDLMYESDAAPSSNLRDADTGEWYRATATITLTRHEPDNEADLEEDWQEDHLND